MKPFSIRALTYNIHKGFSRSNRRFVLKSIKESIQPLGANLVFLQEVIGEHERHAQRIKEWPSSSQFEYLADEIWNHHVYGKNSVYTNGHHGNAILSAFPITHWSNLDISTNAFERRGLLMATIEISRTDQLCEGDELRSPAKTLQCFCVHLSLFQNSRKQQIQKIAEVIHQQAPGNTPFILAGDFNDWRNRATDELAERLGATEAFLSRHGEHARSYPAEFPMLHLDRMYLRGGKVIEARTLQGKLWSRLSDHLGLYVEIEVNSS